MIDGGSSTTVPADRARARAWKRAARILCVRLDQLGDVLMTTPALRALRAGHPDRRLTLLTSSGAAALGPMLTDVSDVIAYDPPWMKATAARDDPVPDLAMLERLRAGGYDAAVIFTVNTQSALPAALLCHLAGIPLRLAHARENVYGLISDRVPEPETALATRHEARRQLDLVASVGFATDDEHLSLRVPAEASREMRRLLPSLGLDVRRPWAVVHPGATAPSRRYPGESYAEVARALVADHGWQLVFTGHGPEETELVDAIVAAAGVPAISLAGRLGIGELAATIAIAPLLIANNTGPMHMAAAVATPVVALYALTNPQHTPWQVPSRVLSYDVPCRWCLKSVCPEGHHLCLRGVPADEVVRAALELAAETADTRRHVAAEARRRGAKKEQGPAAASRPDPMPDAGARDTLGAAS